MCAKNGRLATLITLESEKKILTVRYAVAPNFILGLNLLMYNMCTKKTEKHAMVGTLESVKKNCRDMP
jgi:hypothetical protein